MYEIKEKETGFMHFLDGLMTIDIWILLKARNFFLRCFTRLTPILEASFFMALGAGLLFAYAMAYVEHVDNTIPTQPKPSTVDEKMKQTNLLGIVDSSRIDTWALEKELTRLKSKALSLEMTLRKMNLQLKSLCHKQKTGEDELADFASEAAGGWVVSTPETLAYYDPNAVQVTLLGIPVWRPNYYTPRKVIQPWTQAGECWAFQGSRGKIEIQLASTAMIDRVTLEHIPVSSSLTGKIDSAPRTFNVLGKYKDKYIFMDTFVYNHRGPPSQTFEIKKPEMKAIPFNTVILDVQSNWGNQKYTCIYRFKVHGKMYEGDTISSPRFPEVH